MASKVGSWGVDPEYLFSPLATMERPRVSRGDTRMPEQTDGIGVARPTQHDYATAYALTIDVATRIFGRSKSRYINKNFLSVFFIKRLNPWRPLFIRVPFFGSFFNSSRLLMIYIVYYPTLTSWMSHRITKLAITFPNRSLLELKR